MIFIMTMIWKVTPRLCVAVLPALFLYSLSSRVPLLPFPLILFFAFIRLSHIGSPPFLNVLNPQLVSRTRIQRCSSCSSSSGPSSHPRLRLQLLTLLYFLFLLGTPCMTTTDGALQTALQFHLLLRRSLSRQGLLK